MRFDLNPFFRSLLDGIPDPIYLKNHEQRWVFANEALALLLDQPLEQLIGQMDHDFLPLEYADQNRAADTLVLNTGIPQKTEIGFCSPSGTLRILQTQRTLLHSDNSQTFVLGVIHDLTEFKRLEKTLTEQRTAAVRSAKMASLGEMAGGIAHEINGPLAVIHGSAHQLLELADEGSVIFEPVSKLAKRILRTSDRIEKTIHGLKAFARDGNHDPLVRTSVQKIIVDTVEFCQERFRHHEIDLRVPQMPSEIEIDCRPVQVSQAILNLLTNSFDAVKDQKSAWVEIQVHESETSVTLEVSDSGRGIPPELRGKVMEPFFTTKGAGQGTGLGLSIVSEIMKAHGGALLLNNDTPHTCFVLSFPKVKATFAG